ncbi:MAG: bifunctional 4-hydroxy-3-methylbut-2-enyl diphosphate reductase/30S ribosomal protein S1 [Limnochordia bacterium]|nr:bifunctional 4-hydroxy-3-methylbut-2-enyl diphosphate reductase/30S ribosomal protein S1 [Bacillota bacterium]NLL08101.1 bifunctional 4-hydroxy-3-methylbut-2-enyl diphosphate reductase/30S ribosomal protein S1 [Bacillota bacterium]HBG08777.1 4-hydroxy-3-methylbut-2-enyl diphosphate reductase [Bacillota bacterium]
MEVILADAAGFCFGVKRALSLTNKVLSEVDPATPIYTLGPLIHNPQVVAQLEAKGVRALDRPGEASSGVVIVRSHGVAPKVMEELEELNHDVVDATCPFVQRAMRWAKQLSDEGYQVIIVGDRFHPEVQAILGYAGETAQVVSNPQEISTLPIASRVGVIAQTTQSVQNFKACVDELAGKVEDLKTFDTICTATEQRQTSARELAAKVDVMVVIGGRNSANTKRLAELCQEQGTVTYHIETPDELQRQWFTGVQRAGVSAGASTPDWLIEGVLARMSEFSEEKVTEAMEETAQSVEAQLEEATTEAVEAQSEETQPETVEEASEESAEVSAAPEGDAEVEAEDEPGESSDTASSEDAAEVQMSEYDVTMPTPGAIIKGKVVHVSSDEVLVDIDYKSEGRIPLNELSFISNANPEDLVSVGDEIHVKVLKVDDAEGNVVLSKRRADADLSWERLENLYNSGETLEAKVVQVVKGGLLVNVGVRGFIPASHVSRGFEDNLEKYVGQTLELKIIELDRSKNNVVFSHKVVLEEKHARAKEEAFANLEAGMKVPGVVRRLTDFGAFVDIGDGVEGLLHVSEMAYSRVNHPSDVVSEGDEITVMVLGVDRERERISLGLKQTIPDPWSTVGERYVVGQKVTGEVTRVVDFGAFVKLEDGIEGLVHISELSHKHVAKAEDVVKSGDQVEVKVISVDPEARRIGLSIKELEPKPQPQPKAKQAQPTAAESSDREELTTNIGDMFGDLFKDDLLR